jgi:hypothetical protein
MKLLMKNQIKKGGSKLDTRINKLLILILFIAIPIAGLALMTPDAHAYVQYSTDGTDNCAACHGDFRARNYVSQSDGSAWNDTLMNGHKDMIASDCNVCHLGSKFPVPLNQSDGDVNGDFTSGCVGCHGRAEDGPGQIGDGLRAHHAQAGIGVCAGCHPSDTTPVSEDTPPENYFTPDGSHAGKPSDPCNTNGTESRFGPTGLDNDGDGLYDENDPDCACVPTTDPETICNGIDDDCDGEIDEDYSPMPTSCGVGACASTGLTTCVDGVEGDTCTPGTPAPDDATCDGVDDDCDGANDEDYMIDALCGLGVCGPPNNTPSSCFDGVETACQPGPADEPGMEMTCNDGLDNDCDGVFDDVTNNPATPDPDCTGCTDVDMDGFSPDGGACGLVDCNDGDDTIFPGADETVCNGVDNDCDLAIDEDYQEMQTNCGTGACAATGLMVCIDGVEDDTCTPGTPAADDATCDGVDDDCDNLVDEDYMSMPTTCGQGVCESTGNSVCIDGVVDDGCTPGVPDEATDVTCDGFDGDCDGMIDEDFVPQTTSCGLGPCQSSGVTECVDGAENDTCTPLPAPEPDTELTCDDMIDNDCDGLTDDAEDPDCGAEVIPPPVRQNLGFNDASIASFTEEDCRFCHEDPDIVDDANIPNRHHLRVGLPVDSPTVRPFPDGDTDGNYDCFSCHNMIWDPDTQSTQLEIFRDCIFCHNTGSPHHGTPQALAQECDFCHGPVVNPFDGHQIPTTTPSLVTPEPSGGLGLPLNSRGNGAGACTYCHDSGLTEAGFDADTNKNLHHNTGLGPAFDPGVYTCDWCHKDGNPFSTDLDRIRTCERCHGFESLHNIQSDSNATGDVDTDGDGIPDTPNEGNILPNFENPYWGHIGNNDDCWGCHGFSAASAPGTGGIIPHVELLSQYSVTAGVDTTLTLTGVALTNTVQTPEGPLALDSQVVLTAKDGTATILATTAISESSMDVVVPASLAAGNYKLRAVKGSVDSNAVGLAVIPGVTITGADCDKKRGIITITGSGFGTKPEGTDADISVEVNGVVYDSSSLTSWSDTQIRVSVGSCSKNPTVTVNALFGSATLEGGNNKPPKPCKGKKC